MEKYRNVLSQIVLKYRNVWGKTKKTMQQSLHRQWGSVVWFCGLFFRKERVSELVCRQLYRNCFWQSSAMRCAKTVAPIGVFGGVCLQAAARDFQCASVRLGKGLIFDKRRSCRQLQKFFQKIQKCNCTKKQREGRLMRPSLLIVCDFGSLLLSSISRMPTILRLQLPNR